MAFQSKDSLILGRQLEAQEVIVDANLVAATSDLPAKVSIDNSTIAATVITLDAGEAVAKCFFAEVRNRATGAVVAIAAAPSVSGSEISVTCDATGLSDAAISFKYKVQE
jgi:hypothetical protein